MKMHSQENPAAAFVPMLYLKDLAAAITFYKKAFGATERWRVSNADGSVHVAEMDIPPASFRMHEEVSRDGALSPPTLKGTTVIINLLVPDPDRLAAQAIAAGAKEVSPMRDYEYGFRQGTIADPFGHLWCLERMDDLNKIPKLPS
ncbi:VOC family protein [Fulvivirgaceae bacterium PWU4]|uniref:VOC family protein n=1 Tax=Chryseosolibacter histidini TaxID=2782349 RepID=A0AAP2GKH4_9BACT|nr:VOC family protein [Chryseosolibacter histidini]MBT1699039.1 VOC family protein [Chryseosolibacter histidini]